MLNIFIKGRIKKNMKFLIITIMLTGCNKEQTAKEISYLTSILDTTIVKVISNHNENLILRFQY